MFRPQEGVGGTILLGGTTPVRAFARGNTPSLLTITLCGTNQQARCSKAIQLIESTVGAIRRTLFASGEQLEAELRAEEACWFVGTQPNPGWFVSTQNQNFLAVGT